MTEIVIAAGETLPFYSKKQEALLGHLLQQDSFFLQSHSLIKPEWFLDPWCSKIWAASKAFFDEYKRKPGIDELKYSFQVMKEDQGAQNRMVAKIGVCTIAAGEFGLDVLRSELTTWLKSRLFKAHTERAMLLHNAAAEAPNPTEKFAEAFNALKIASTEIERASFAQEVVMDFGDIASGTFFDYRENEKLNALCFGNHLVDIKLNPDCIGGALLRGDHTVVLAPVNSGKTTTMITVAIENIRRGKSVLFLTHEGRPDDLKTKMLSCLTRLSASQLRDLSLTPEGQAKLFVAANMLTKYLTYLPLNKPFLTVEEVEGAIRRQQERRIAYTGSGYDLIVDDYPAKLWTREAGKQWARRQIDEHVYNFFTNAALDLGCHVLTAVQTNREGSKINKGMKGQEDRLLSIEDVAESFGVMATATNVISLNRNPEAMARQRLTFHICKSRSSDTGWSIVTRTDYGRGRTHGDDLESTVYRGQSPMTDTIEDLLQKHAGKAIPEGYTPS